MKKMSTMEPEEMTIRVPNDIIIAVIPFIESDRERKPKGMTPGIFEVSGG